MSKLKKNKGMILFVGIILGVMITCSITVYATTMYNANQITYKNNKTVEQALNELYTNKELLETTTIVRGNVGKNQTLNIEKENYKCFLVSTYNFSGSLFNGTDAAKVEVEGANSTEITSTYYGTVTSTNAVHRLYLIKPISSSFKVFFPTANDIYCVCGLNEEINLNSISNAYGSSINNLNISDNEYDYYLVGTSYCQNEYINCSKNAYINVDDHRAKLIINGSYATIDDETNSRAVGRVFLVKSNKTNTNMHINFLGSISTYFICGLNIQ